MDNVDFSPMWSPKAPVDPRALDYRAFLDGPFWQHIPAYKNVSENEFIDHKWQMKHAITTPNHLLSTIQELAPPGFIEDAARGFTLSPMSVRVSPYLLALINWTRPYEDPLRSQFIPLASRFMPDHPKVLTDPLQEQLDAPSPGLTHRYLDRALLVALNSCPVYCRFCTRSYAIGAKSKEYSQIRLGASRDRWRNAIDYIRSRPEIEDVVVSGGDAYHLRPEQIFEIGTALLASPYVRRLRFATRGPAVMPQKIISDTAWTDALTRIVERGRRDHKEVAVHTHFNHPNEVTAITRRAMNIFMERGITVRNQSVLLRGVNDSADVMTTLIKRLGFINVHAYYVYLPDLVRGIEDIRTSVGSAVDIEKNVRGSTAGYNTPTFVVDTPGGGGKRDVHSYEYYDRENGISVFQSPVLRPRKLFIYVDPLDMLSKEAIQRWSNRGDQEQMICAAISRARTLMR